MPVHKVTDQNHYSGLENRALESTGRFKHIVAQEQTNSSSTIDNVVLSDPLLIYETRLLQDTLQSGERCQ